jgi:hypothetical protein
VRVLALLMAVPLLAACGSDRDAYCKAVAEHQEELSDIVGSGESDALLRALDVFEELRQDAPDDISDEWQQVVGSIEALRDALERAGVDPATYEREDPPDDLAPEDKAAIDAAARQLGGGTTLRALEDLDQQARDVCKTPLTL